MSNRDSDSFVEISRVLPLLPYADQLEAYANAAAAGLKESLRRLLSSNTYMSYCSSFPKLIYKYIGHFGVRFTKKELIDIINFGLAVAFCPQVDDVSRDCWKHFLTFLLGLLSTFISNEELQLEWKTFQRAYMRDYTFSENFTYSYNLAEVDLLLIEKAKSYFTLSCVQEIWESERPQIYASLVDESFDGIFDNLRRFTPNQLNHFEEIKSVWLDEIFYMWYQYPTFKMHKAVVKLLAPFSQHFPGRVDMIPHLDRVFSFLIEKIHRQGVDEAILTSSANLIVNSIVPGSDVLRMLKNFFDVVCWNHRRDNENIIKGHLLYFCYQLILEFCRRFNWEFTWTPELTNHIGEVVEWARLTNEQVDEFVELLLPICYDTNLFFGDQCNACNSIQTLATIRPRLMIPRMIKSIEEGYLTPEFPENLEKSLKILSFCPWLFFSPAIIPVWDKYIGFQPCNQPQNFPIDNRIPPRIKSPEQRKLWESNFSALIYPECRLGIPRIMKLCLNALDLTNIENLFACVNILIHIFTLIPIRDFSDTNQSEANIEDEGTMRTVLGSFTFRKLVESTAGVEDLVVDIWRRIFELFEKENQNLHVHIEGGQSSIWMKRFLNNLSTLARYIAVSASHVPRLRVRLCDAFLKAIMGNQWFYTVSSAFPCILWWLLCGPRFEGTSLSQSDTALYALNKFWPLFKNYYYELKSDNSITREGRTDPRLISLVYILNAFFVIFVPIRVEEVMDDFISPALNILFDLLEISLGSEGQCPPSKDLADCASECLGVLLYRLVTISMDFRNVDFFNSEGYTRDPLWSPLVDYRKASDLVKWIKPNERTFGIARDILDRFLLPLLGKLSAISDELSTCLADRNVDQMRDPHISVTTKQSEIASQRSYLTSLISWIWNISSSIFEGLRPRDIGHEDMNYVNQICSELEALRHEYVTCPESSSSIKDFRLDIPLFDHLNCCLRDQIFRCGLRFLDVLAKLSTKFDMQMIEDVGQCVIDKLLDVDQLNTLLNLTSYAGFNCVKNIVVESHNLTDDFQVPIESYCLGFHMTFTDPQEIACSIGGPSSEILSALARGEVLNLGCPFYGISHLPISWLMHAKRQHFNFIRRAIGMNAVWPGTEALSLITNPRLPANRELNQFIETFLQIGLNCSEIKVLHDVIVLYFYSKSEVPGATVTFARLLMEALKPFYESDIFSKGAAEYRICSFRLKRAMHIMDELHLKTSFSNELYNNNPTLWSQMWAILLNLCICSDFAKTQLTTDQIEERIIDQKGIARMIDLETIKLNPFVQYFHASYDPETYPKTSPLRHLILSAQKLLITLGGCKESMIKYKPLLLVKAGKLRRDAYRHLIQTIDKLCLLDDDIVESNSENFSYILAMLPIVTDNYSTYSLNAALPDVEAFQRTAPLPPMPSLSTIKRALKLLSNKSHSVLITAASTFIYTILMEFCLSVRKLKLIAVNWRSIEMPKKCEGFKKDSLYNCLSPENFTLKNHILSLINSVNYFRTTSVWVDPCASAAFPSFSNSNETVLKIDFSKKEWLEFPAEMDLSEISPYEIIEWQKGITIIAEYFANVNSWNQLSDALLNYYGCTYDILMDNLKRLIRNVLWSFGPHPYLKRVEDFVMSLLKPTLTPDPQNEILMVAGTTLANEILYAVAVGSYSWPRDMKLELFGRVLPRLIIYAEAASQKASIEADSIISQPLPPFLSNISLIVPSRFTQDIATTPESISYFQEENRPSPASRNLACRICYGDWGQDGIYVPNEKDFIKFPDPCGPKLQIRFPVTQFFKMIDVSSIVSVYVPYIWRCIWELGSVGSGKHISRVKKSDCGHNVPEGDGECPVCVGCRLFSRIDQRQALKDKIIVEILALNFWDTTQLLKYFNDAGMGLWEKKVCKDSPWNRFFSMLISIKSSAAGYHVFRNSAPPTLRLYKSDVTDGDAPKFSEHQVKSALVTELIPRLLNSETTGLQRKSLIGPDFVMKRYLPLFVRDLMAYLLIKDVNPSVASFAVQDDLLSGAAERITPATKRILEFSKHTKNILMKRLRPRFSQMEDCLKRHLIAAYHINVLPSTRSESLLDVLCRLGPLLADRSGGVIKDKAAYTEGHDFLRKILMGHTNTKLVINQVNRVLDYLDAFIKHAKLETRNLGLNMMYLLKLFSPIFWKKDSAVDVLRCRLKHCLCNLLEDSSTDIAWAAARELTNALKRNMLEYNEEWFRELKEQSRTIKHSKKVEVVKANLQHRRAGVFGLCAIVLAHPSQVPNYLPKVIIEVARHAEDSHPIGKVAAKTVKWYYRHVFKFLTFTDRRKFSDKQIEIIELVVTRAA